MGNDRFVDIWERFQSEKSALDDRLLAEYEAIWRDTESILESLVIAVLAEPGLKIEPSLDAIDRFFDGPGRRLLARQVGELRKARPYVRALEALEGYRSTLEDLSRRLPQIEVISGKELVDAVGTTGISRITLFLVRRREAISLPLRGVIEARFSEELNQRTRLHGAFFLTIAKTILAILPPWQDVRRTALLALAGDNGYSQEDEQKSRTEWSLNIGALRSAAAGIFAGMRRESSRTTQQLISSVLRGKVFGSARGSHTARTAHRTQFSFWSRQHRAVWAVVDLELNLWQVASDMVSRSSQSLAAFDYEDDSLFQEIDGAVEWLKEAQGKEESTGFPPPSAKLRSAEDHAGAWRVAVEAAGRGRLAAEIETVVARSALMPRFAPWRRVQPLTAFLVDLTDTAYPIVLDGFRQAEAEHRSSVREIERAREVVDFSSEMRRNEDGDAISRDGLVNALALMEHLRRTAVDPRASVELHLVEAVSKFLRMTHDRLEQNRLGVLAQLAGQRGSRVSTAAWQVLLSQTARLGRLVSKAIQAHYHSLLLWVGWETAPVTGLDPVVSRGYLNDVLNLQTTPRELPAIYRRLFRLAPVEDPRFLVGRHSELRALARARGLWEANRPVSVLLIGARGSGKTSLLNCAVSREFADVTVVRSQFSQRVPSREAMHEFLRTLLGVDESQDLIAALSERRTVVILEELERTFLRRMNGFEGLQELLEVVSATSRGTLWILGLNQRAYMYLDAAVGLSQYFSHRINAMAISAENLKTAILLRHKLSGLRLFYPAIAPSRPGAEWFRRRFGLNRSAEDAFFDSLYVQSEGIFRSAFELWQHYIERSEGGVLYLKQPVEPSPDSLIEQLTQEDVFTLQAILQHGSLTPEDHAEIFECPLAKSRLRLEKLAGLECLESDPAGPGLRVRPEAGRIVHMALDRLNL